MEKKYDNGDLKCPPLDFYIAEPKRSKSRSEFQGNEGPSTLGRTFIDVSLSFDRLLFNLSGISGELFEHFESAVDSLIKYARLTAMTNLCRRHFTAARWEPLCSTRTSWAWCLCKRQSPLGQSGSKWSRVKAWRIKLVDGWQDVSRYTKAVYLQYSQALAKAGTTLVNAPVSCSTSWSSHLTDSYSSHLAHHSF